MDRGKDSARVQRLEVVELGRRRRWSAAAKLRIVEESFAGWRWRKAYRAGALEAERARTISADAAAHRLDICVPSVHRLIRRGMLPATQLMPSAPWQIPLAALDTEEVRIGLQQIAARRPTKAWAVLDERMLRLPGL